MFRDFPLDVKWRVRFMELYTDAEFLSEFDPSKVLAKPCSPFILIWDGGPSFKEAAIDPAVLMDEGGDSESEYEQSEVNTFSITIQIPSVVLEWVVHQRKFECIGIGFAFDFLISVSLLRT